MAITNIEYTVSKLESHGWIIQRNGAPLGRRQKLLQVVSFTTHMAEHESMSLMGSTRIFIAQIDV
jgi:hypothetical protein